MPEKEFPQTHAGMVEALGYVENVVAEWDDEMRDRVVLVAGEALSNAIEHGYESPEQTLRVEVLQAEHELELVIQEATPGVHQDQVEASMLPEDPLATSGRGLFLIRTLADVVEPHGDHGYRYTFRSRSRS